MSCPSSRSAARRSGRRCTRGGARCSPTTRGVRRAPARSRGSGGRGWSCGSHTPSRAWSRRRRRSSACRARRRGCGCSARTGPGCSTSTRSMMARSSTWSEARTTAIGKMASRELWKGRQSIEGPFVRAACLHHPAYCMSALHALFFSHLHAGRFVSLYICAVTKRETSSLYRLG